MNKHMKAAIVIAPLFAMSGCFPPGGGQTIQVQNRTCQTLPEVKKNGINEYLSTFGAQPVIATMDKETAIAFDKVYSKDKGVPSEEHLDSIVHFSNGKYDIIVFMNQGCATVASKVMHDDFLTWMGKL